MSDKYESHEIADCWPMIEPEKFGELCDDIAENGLLNSIVLFEGKILDGRNRYKACVEVGVEPTFTEYDGDDPTGHAISLNNMRRDLNPSQRAMVAEKLANICVGDYLGNQHEACADLRTPAVSQSEAAEQMGVSRRLVQKARRVNSGAEEGITSMVEDGDLSLEAAEHLMSLTEDEQRQIAEAGKEAAKEAAKDVRLGKVTRVNMKEVNLTPRTLAANLQNLSRHLNRHTACLTLTPESMADAFREHLQVANDKGLPRVYREWVNEIHDGLELFYKAIQIVKNDSSLKSVSKGD